ncbi:MAG: LamG-like jellyroll fold domain-containing protein [Candidatus Brocadiia bacterium]
MKTLGTLAVSCLALAFAAGAAGQEYSWQKSHATVIETGDLQWAPEPFVFQPGETVRYIDFEDGDDANPGTRAAPWKHHPWDPAAGGRSAASGGVDTYVFKRGVTYRGRLVARESGQPERPIRLTSDPSWGEGQAVLCGSETVTGWQKGAEHPDIPDADKAWVADVQFLPRRIWMVEDDGGVTRIPLARTPNWQVTDPEEVLSEWWEWENPEWWVEKNRTTTVDGTKMHLGIDPEHLTREPEYYRDAIVWTEWAIVMGTPFPTPVVKFFPLKKAIAFEGRWFRDSGQINAGNRYFLENKPHYLDAAGEFWVEKRDSGSRLYLRLPEDRDPNTVTIEAAKLYNLIQDQASANSPRRLDVIGEEGRARVDTTGVSHLRVSGLTFRFTNAWWDYHYAPWQHKQVDNASVRLLGAGDDIRISNCRFEHVSKGVRINPINRLTQIGSVAVTDNEIQYTDDAAITIGEGKGHLEDVSVLRNRLYMIGLRPFRQSDAHALAVSFPTTMEVAGNVLRRTYGAGIFLFGGKPSGAGGDVPLARYLVHHNRAEQTLLATNDWGGIETWQGGPFYVYNNLSANPNGYWNWAAGKPFGARLGYAFYHDGGHKNYDFNNILWGLNNDPDSKLCHPAAINEATPTTHNSYVNNTIYRFSKGSDWSPAGGHHRFLGNIWSDISHMVFRHGRLKEDTAAQHEEEYPHELMAYGHNVFYKIGEMFGVFEVSGKGYEDFAAFRQALARQQTLDPTLGVKAEAQPLRDPANRDMRLAEGSDAIDQGVKFFVPWALARMVGEWNFYHVGGDATVIPDEHWYMWDYYRGRGGYHAMPQYPLKAVNVGEENYVQGDLENWIAGALKLNGQDQYAFVGQEALNAQPPGAEEPVELQTVDVRETSFILEIYFKTRPGTKRSVLMQKMGPQAGYALTIDGSVTLRVRSGGQEASVAGATPLNDGEWHHLLAEADRAGGRLTIYVDGRKDGEAAGLGASLSNTADFYVGGTPDGDCLAGTVDFARVSLGSLAEAKTTIEELYTWQFDGPQFRDFAGNRPVGRRDAGALELVPEP